MTARTRLKYLFATMDWEAEELTSSYMAALFGLWIVSVAYRLSLRGPTLDSLRTVLPLWAWGAIGLAIGIYGLMALINDGPKWRLSACLIRLFFWLFLTALTLQVAPTTNQFVIFIGLATLSFVASWKLLSVVRGQ